MPNEVSNTHAGREPQPEADIGQSRKQGNGQIPYLWLGHCALFQVSIDDGIGGVTCSSQRLDELLASLLASSVTFIHMTPGAVMRIDKAAHQLLRRFHLGQPNHQRFKSGPESFLEF